MVIDCHICRAGFFQFPSILSLIVQQFGMVISLVKVFEDRRENLWLLVGQVDSPRRVKELSLECGKEEWRTREDLFVASKESLF